MFLPEILALQQMDRNVPMLLRCYHDEEQTTFTAASDTLTITIPDDYDVVIGSLQVRGYTSGGETIDLMTARVVTPSSQRFNIITDDTPGVSSLAYYNLNWSGQLYLPQGYVVEVYMSKSAAVASASLGIDLIGVRFPRLL